MNLSTKENLSLEPQPNSELTADEKQVSPSIANAMLGDALGDSPSFHETIMNDFYKKVWTKWDEKLKDYLQKNLKEFGYEFESDEDFILFIKARITKISFGQNSHELYLDYVNEDERGILIGSYSDKVEIINDGCKITAVVGRSIA